MKVIMLENVPKVGHKYEVKNVSDGYASNFLIPHKLAVIATASLIKQFETRKAQEDEERKVQEDLLIKNLDSLTGQRVIVSAEANDQGHLFAGIHDKDIVAALKSQTELDIMPEHLKLPEPIKSTGEHNISVQVGEKKTDFTLVVESK